MKEKMLWDSILTSWEKKVTEFQNFKENEFVELRNSRELSCGAPQLNEKNILRMSENDGAKVLMQGHLTKVKS